MDGWGQGRAGVYPKGAAPTRAAAPPRPRRRQVAEMLAGVAAPVLYWEQGHEWLFGDPVRLQAAQNYLKQDIVSEHARGGA